MAMTATVLGFGACGNKAVIALIEAGVIDREHAKILNTTDRDVPEKYSDPDLFTLYSKLAGAGKESDRGRAAIIEAIRDKSLNLGALLNEDSQEVILVSSVEGGTGSSGAPVAAKYFDAMNIPIHVFAFIGFQNEARGINNTLKFFKNLPSNVILHTINNSFFLDYTNNHSRAETAANEEFVREVEILLGQKIVPSKHNIDQMDLYKINTQPGYMTINHIDLTNIKNIDGFNAAIAASFENACYMDSDQSAKRFACIINASRKVQDCIDNSFEVVKRYVGTPIEIFQHIQPDFDDDLSGGEYIDIIACGLNYPEKAIHNMNTLYTRLKEKLNVSRKSMADIFTGIDVKDEIDDLNMSIKQRVDPSKVEDLFADEVLVTETIDSATSKPIDPFPEQIYPNAMIIPDDSNDEPQGVSQQIPVVSEQPVRQFTDIVPSPMQSVGEYAARRTREM